ncbi:MAG TPA: hypothetical protein VN231_06165 [Allosphingosinicella sp.]|nr:hypothetical protein [Allosphingosinicella sp.]
MASVYTPETNRSPFLDGRLGDPRLAIGGPLFDALLLWGCPLVCALFVWLWLGGAAMLPPGLEHAAVASLAAAVAIVTFAHLVAVVPRAYLNPDVFAAHRRRLTWVPILLVAALLASPALLVCAGVLAIFWDVHHSAMQTFGLARIYDMKAGNKPLELRQADLRLNWVLYVGPIAAGASLMDHVGSLRDLGPLGWAAIAGLPSLAESQAGAIRMAAVAAWIAIGLWAAWDYRSAVARGYRLPVHKAALVGSTALVSIAAWGLAPPIAAFAIINLFHALQYFALVWLKEGGRIEAACGRLTGGLGDRPDRRTRSGALALFLVLCLGFGLAYHGFRDLRWLGGPFIACSLLHFWYDSFVWSVRKRQV